MGIATLPVIAARLIAAGRDPATPAAVIERGLTADQRVVTGMLGNIAERAAGLTSPAVIVIGEVAAMQAASPQYPASAAGASVPVGDR
jgi:uroporphyrin-III C-methyltransferase/precorrin-2 dehydrogenase/sirohydrochlorin ferrochelatase